MKEVTQLDHLEGEVQVNVNKIFPKIMTTVSDALIEEGVENPSNDHCIEMCAALIGQYFAFLKQGCVSEKDQDKVNADIKSIKSQIDYYEHITLVSQDSDHSGIEGY